MQSAILGPELIIGRKKPERENYHLHTSRDRVERSMITKLVEGIWELCAVANQKGKETQRRCEKDSA